MSALIMRVVIVRAPRVFADLESFRVFRFMGWEVDMHEHGWPPVVVLILHACPDRISHIILVKGRPELERLPPCDQHAVVVENMHVHPGHRQCPFESLLHPSGSNGSLAAIYGLFPYNP